ncbi:MAG: hypothetical protein JNL28_08185 [Planctomycetes bacterium]|nr:hypothetical protein [Planctomycetota bacterium]
MNRRLPPPAFPLALALVSLCAPSTTVRAADATPPRPALSSLGSIPFDRVAWDEPGDGAVWVRGASYKASFGARGAQYMPAFGPRQPHNEVLTFSPDRVRVAGNELEFDAGAPARRVGSGLEFARGAFTERYEIALESIEQTFVFETLPVRGALELRIPVTTALDVLADDDGLSFVGEFGRVTYSRAIVIDADGRRTPAATDFEDGAIVIRVDAACVASARLPLVIDPVVTTTHFDSTTSDTFSPDATWSATDGSWLVVYNVAFSATDNDVFARQMSSSGVAAPGDWIDFTSNSWTAPRCATITPSDRMIVVAEQSTSVPKGVWGRIAILSGTTITFPGSQFNIGGTSAGDKTRPDVGGDSSLSGFKYACVAWTHTLGGGDTEIGYALVDANGSIFLPPTYLPHDPGALDSAVSVSKSNGTTSWVIAWQHYASVTSTFTDIHAARVAWNGVIVNPPFVVAASLLFETGPSVSSPLSGTNRNVIVFRKNPLLATQADVGVVAIDGATVLQYVDLSLLENSGMQSVDQLDASVDSDGQHFLVAYSEKVPAFGYYDLYATDLFLSGNALKVAQGHVFTYNISLPVLHGQVAATGGNSPLPRRYFVPFDITQNSTDHDVSGSLFDGFTGGTVSVFCSGDGTGTPCPCGNSGATAFGCAHSASAAGARLWQIAGTASTTSDYLQLQAANLPPGAPCLFFQGTLQTAGAAFGDGLFCAQGTITRLAVVFAAGTSANAPFTISSLGGVPAAGGFRTYQAWYRDANTSFCTASTFNLTNGLAVDWSH